MLTRSPHIVIARAPARASRPKATARPALPAIVHPRPRPEPEADQARRADAADRLFQQMARAARG